MPLAGTACNKIIYPELCLDKVPSFTLACAQLELRDVQSRTKLQERRRPSDLVEVVRLNGRAFQFLYKDEGECYRHVLCLHVLPETSLPNCAIKGIGCILMAGKGAKVCASYCCHSQ